MTLLTRRIESRESREERAELARKELERRKSASGRRSPERLLFGSQAKYATDTSNFVAACCSRRAGKSFGSAFRLCTAAEKHPGALLPYIVRSREDARNIIWPALQLFDKEAGLGLRFMQNTGDVVFPNGSRIILRGAGSRREIDKLRGPAYPGAIIDEAQGFSKDELDYLIDDVLGPVVVAQFGGSICLAGTPNAACAGPFYDICMGFTSGWSLHGWTMADNPFMKNKDAYIARLLESRHWTPDHPSFQREYLGRWVRDTMGLVFRLSETLNVVDAPELEEAEDAEYTLGIDLGFNDPSAFVVLRYSEYLNRCEVVESWKESKLIPSAVAAKVEALRQKYELASIVADSGGYGKAIVEELREKYHIPVLPAQKQGKGSFVELLNGDLAAGLLRIPRTERALLDEMRLLQWDADKVERGRLEFDGRFADHLCDALLYAWRDCRHQGEDRDFDGPKPNTPAWYDAQAKAEEAAADEKWGGGPKDKPSWWERLWA